MFSDTSWVSEYIGRTPSSPPALLSKWPATLTSIHIVINFVKNNFDSKMKSLEIRPNCPNRCLDIRRARGGLWSAIAAATAFKAGSSLPALRHRHPFGRLRAGSGRERSWAEPALSETKGCPCHELAASKPAGGKAAVATAALQVSGRLGGEQTIAVSGEVGVR